MSISYPSRRVTVVDVPEVLNFRARFIYNFFTPDESVNDSGDVPEADKRIAEGIDAFRIDQSRRTIPRLVRFDFNKVVFARGSPAGSDFVQQPNAAGQINDVSIGANLAHIQTESEFSGDEHVGLEFQDNNIDRKLFAIVSGSVAKRVASKNRGIRQEIDEARQTVFDNLRDEHSLLDAAKALADETSPGVSSNLIINSLNQLEALKLKFIDDDAQRELTNDTFARVRNVSVRGQVVNKLVGTIFKTVINDPMSTFSDEFVSMQRRAAATQLRAIARTDPNVINRAELDPTFRVVAEVPTDVQDYPVTTRILGYVIEKHEVLPDGKLKAHIPIVIENADIGTAVDLRVAYGRTYIYTIRTVAQLRARATVEDTDGIVLGVGLVSSRRSSRLIVRCVEEVPPPAPADFNVMWDYTNSAPLLTWSFPPNRQRDIKRFQVFRRRSIDEPFELLRELDFDDSQVRAQSGETPEPLLVEKLTGPVTTYRDREFQRDWHAIYALCSIDAHGFSSGYSLQLEIWFDALKNRIEKRIVSFSGAPKSYPNMSLNTDLFVDSMRVSGASRMRVVFDPEFLRVTDVEGNDLKLLTFTNVEGGKYRIQLINTDVAQQEIVDVAIKDVRPTGGR